MRTRRPGRYSRTYIFHGNPDEGGERELYRFDVLVAADHQLLLVFMAEGLPDSVLRLDPAMPIDELNACAWEWFNNQTDAAWRAASSAA
jgi:hypothetical protein